MLTDGNWRSHDHRDWSGRRCKTYAASRGLRGCLWRGWRQTGRFGNWHGHRGRHHQHGRHGSLKNRTHGRTHGRDYRLKLGSRWLNESQCHYNNGCGFCSQTHRSHLTNNNGCDIDNSRNCHEPSGYRGLTNGRWCNGHGYRYLTSGHRTRNSGYRYLTNGRTQTDGYRCRRSGRRNRTFG